MTKTQFVELYAQKTGKSLKEATVDTNAFIEALSEGLVSDESIHLNKLGTFSVKERGPRKIRSIVPPHELIDIAQRKYVKFKAAKHLLTKIAK